MYALLFNDGTNDRAEIIALSKSKTKIIEELEKIKNSYNPTAIFEYIEEEELILNDDSWWYIEKCNNILN